MSPSKEPVKLQQTEVSGCRWVPLSYFSSPKIVRRKKPVLLKNTVSFIPRPLLYLAEKLSLEAVFFPTIMLPEGDEVMEKKNIYGRRRRHDPVQYELWGLTLGICKEVFMVAKYNSIHIYTSMTTNSQTWNTIFVVANKLHYKVPLVVLLLIITLWIGYSSL